MIVQYGKKASLFLIFASIVACNGATTENQQGEIEQQQEKKKEKSWWAALPFVVPPVVILGYRFFSSRDSDVRDEPPKVEEIDDGTGLGDGEGDQPNSPPSPEEQASDKQLPNSRSLPRPSLRSDRQGTGGTRAS